MDEYGYSQQAQLTIYVKCAEAEDTSCKLSCGMQRPWSASRLSLPVFTVSPQFWWICITSFQRFVWENNYATLDSLRQPCWFSRRVRDLTQRLEDHNSRTLAPLQAFTEKFDRVRWLTCSDYMSVVQLAERQAPTLLIAVRVRALM